jgi:transposase
MTRSLLVMTDRLGELGVTRVVMEATSDYWRGPSTCWKPTGSRRGWSTPVTSSTYRGVQDRHAGCGLAVQGRRAADAAAQLRPPRPIRQLRHVTRYRADLVAARTAEKQRVEKLLEDAQIKLSVVASDTFGVSGRAMLAALVAGERDPKVLAQLARARMRAKLSLLEEAFTGFFTDQHAFLLGKMLARVDALDADLAELDAKLEELIAPLARAVDRLDEIPGVGQTAAHLLIAEIGTDMTRFPTAGHLVSWATYAPGVSESAGKRKGSGSTGHGNPYLARVLGEAPSPPARPIPSSVNATGGSPVDAARNAPSSRSAGPSWSSPGTCCPTQRPTSTTSALASTTPVSVPNAPSATTSASSRPSATRSPSIPPPDPAPPGNQRTT